MMRQHQSLSLSVLLLLVILATTTTRTTDGFSFLSLTSSSTLLVDSGRSKALRLTKLDSVGQQETTTDDYDHDDEVASNDFVSTTSSSSSLSSRRGFLASMTSALLLGTTTATAIRPSDEASAYYDQAYPIELNSMDGDKVALRKAAIEAKRQQRTINMNYAESTNPLAFRNVKDVITDSVWGGALWTLLGSRSNPLVTPIANVLYNAEEEDWLKERNQGYFGDLPVTLYPVLIAVFFALGIGMDRIALVLTEGNANSSLQLATVSLITGTSLELGRIFSGEKKATKQELDRETRLIEEFDTFAQQRLMAGGNCHKTEVVKAFRRYYGKYRGTIDPEEEDPNFVSDIEIEQLLRYWNRQQGNEEMSSAGFFKGIQINTQSDVFASRPTSRL